jgi:hypothetical protein
MIQELHQLFSRRGDKLGTASLVACSKFFGSINPFFITLLFLFHFG